MKRNHSSAAEYLDYSGRDDVLSGGVKMIPVETPNGIFRCALYDDQEVYFCGLVQFIQDVNAGRF